MRSIWGGLPTIYRESDKRVVTSGFYEDIDVEGLLIQPFGVRCGFTLEDDSDPQYERVLSHRTQFGEVIHQAAATLCRQREGEDHIDAVMSVSKAIDVFLLEYALPRGSFDALQRTYSASREYVI